MCNTVILFIHITFRYVHTYVYVHIYIFFYVLLTVHLSILVFIAVINQLDAQQFCFTVSLFHASTCFEHMVLETCRGMK